MIEQSNSLLLNEEALNLCADPKKPVFIYEWLRYLDRILPAAQKIYSVGDTYSLFETINFCNDILKGRDDSPTHLPVKLAALQCLGAMYETLGRLVGRSYEESFHLMIKWLKNAESQGRAELLHTFAKLVKGLGFGASSIHKDLYKIVKGHMSDRVMAVRIAALNCLTVLVPEYVFLYTNEVESISTLCFKALESSNYEVRLAVARLFAVLFCAAMDPPKSRLPATNSKTQSKVMSVEECFGILSHGFLRGGIGGFLKTGTVAVTGGQKETRIGVALAYVTLIRELGPLWLEKNHVFVTKHLMELTTKAGPLAYTNNVNQADEVVYMRRCVGYILRGTVGTILGEHAQIAVCKQLGAILADCINSFGKLRAADSKSYGQK
ncbi:unnamed protein product [Gongylonema pulchrum]|uniref:HEAT repeat-containing protein 5B n=1 Tax=Gongylonema pulchrum TaxID=637853 RepID=A0A183EH65_9BILA|nr:unnamed protein product [Gongylonema pulchrum]